ncbi:MAG TPA: fumarylacetoacetate hydrolase family protein [Candidatus Limnocylindria bacterium]|jgi:2-keto-4-pentenoate hydratase/2-oxohepta-3-ene-1,7-dioic acid hydratase in catechol pathway|nr:fumarylacetoacetate hydrolase family protein [Candidatus Limnocylindria bacterium]
MRICTFEESGWVGAGVVLRDDTVVRVEDLVGGVPSDMVGLIAAGPAVWSNVRTAAARLKAGRSLRRGALRAPIPSPRRNVFCVGWNYSEHFEEGKKLRQGGAQQVPSEIPAFPSLFSKNPATVTGPDAPVLFPAPHSEQLDWEVELAVVIGEGGVDIAEADAMRHVLGYTCANDVSVRDVQRRHGGQWFKGKNFDTHLPMGPWIVTADELDPADLAICTRVNGVTKQDSRTRYMVFKVPRLISEISAGCELWPGDIIITGTPAGVGFARTPPEFLKVGDTVEVEIEGIGVLRNTVKGRT